MKKKSEVSGLCLSQERENDHSHAGVREGSLPWEGAVVARWEAPPEGDLVE